MSNDDVQGIAAAQLRSIVERIERLEEEEGDRRRHQGRLWRGQGQRLRHQGASGRSSALRKQEAGEREEQDAILDLYKQALGMVCRAPGAEADRPFSYYRATIAGPDPATQISPSWGAFQQPGKGRAGSPGRARR